MKTQTIVVNDQYCPKNHACPVSMRCPFGAIQQKDPYSAPEIIKEKCRDCGMCTKMCPVFQAIPA